MRKRNNPSVRLVPRLPPPLAQGRLSRKRFSRSDEEGKKCASQPKNLPRGRKIGCFFCRFPVKYCLHLFGCIRDARLLHPCVPLLCRDGGAAERARFEIVLGSDVYQGSNPCLCAKHFEKAMFHTWSFFMLEKPESGCKLNFAASFRLCRSKTCV